MLKGNYHFAIAVCMFLATNSLYPVASQSSPIGNPHALKLQQDYVNEQESGKGWLRDGSESASNEGNLRQKAGKDVSNLKESNYDTIFPYSYRPPNSELNSIGQEKEKMFQKLLWDAKSGIYSLPVLLRALNHPNGWRIKPDEVWAPRPGSFELEERRLDTSPLGDGSQLRSGSVMNVDFPANDIIQKRNSNPGFICHFKLCQLASGKRRFNPGAWSEERDQYKD